VDADVVLHPPHLLQRRLTVRYSSYVLQTFLPMESSTDLRRRVHAMIRESAESATVQDKWNFYRGVTLAIAEQSPTFEYGVWDYVEESGRAEAEFDKWCAGTVQDTRDAAEEEGAVPVYRQAGGPRFMFVTLLFLMRRGGASDRYVCEMCRIPESSWWTKATFSNMFRSLAGLNFESVRADAIYLRPGSDDGGVTPAELALEQYAYLKKLV
jgi:hypothetical protein